MLRTVRKIDRGLVRPFIQIENLQQLHGVMLYAFFFLFELPCSQDRIKQALTLVHVASERDIFQNRHASKQTNILERS